MTRLLFSVLMLFSASLLQALSKQAHASPASSMSKKIAHIESNGQLTHPNREPTILTEQEINAYLASGELKMPTGVQSVQLAGEPGIISGTAQIDFEKVRQGVHSSNPLLSIFSGVHEVQVATHAYGENGIGYVHVDSVSLDGVEVAVVLHRNFGVDVKQMQKRRDAFRSINTLAEYLVANATK